MGDNTEFSVNDKVILVRQGSYNSAKDQPEKMAEWKDTQYAKIMEIERGIRGMIHKVKTYNRTTLKPNVSWFWLEDTNLDAIKFEWP